MNFVQLLPNGSIQVRTYERGVENETLSCGTGVTASALATHFAGKTEQKNLSITTKGGNLKVSFKQSSEHFFPTFASKGQRNMSLMENIFYK